MALIKRRGQALLPLTDSKPHLAYTLSGPEAAPLVVFVNGLGGAQAAFTLQVRDFCKTHRVLTFDHRGMGQSDVVDEPVHMADFAADLVRILDEIGAGQVDLVGLSFGGRVVMHWLPVGRSAFDAWSWGTSAGRPPCPRQVDAHTTLRALSDGDAETWAEQIAPLLFGRAYAERHPERLYSLARWRARHPVNPVGIARQWEAWDSFALGDQIGAIAVPTMVLHGTDDAISPVENAHALVALLPNARLHLMECRAQPQCGSTRLNGRSWTSWDRRRSPASNPLAACHSLRVGAGPNGRRNAPQNRPQNHHGDRVWSYCHWPSLRV